MMAALLPLTSLTLTDQILQQGIWLYLLVFVIITLASTIVGGPIPDNTFLLLAGAVVLNDGLSMEWLCLAAILGGFAGYEINYWSGRIFGIAICRGACPLVLHDGNVTKAIGLIDRFGAASLILSRFLPVLNLPSFLAGVHAMEYRRYVVFNLVSSVVWSGTLLLLGYYAGSIAIVSTYLDYLTDIFLVVLAAAVLFTIGRFARDWMRRDTGPPAV